MLMLGLLTTSCASYKRPTISYLPEKKDPSYTAQKTALEHPVYNYIPRKREQIKWFDIGHRFNSGLLGNDDDGVFGERAGFSTNITMKTFWAWQRRNPLHNFTFYVIGSAQWKKHHHFAVIKADHVETKLFTVKHTKVTGESQRAFLFTFNDYKPFTLFRLFGMEGYLGWRATGNFGAAFRKWHPPDGQSKPVDAALKKQESR